MGREGNEGSGDQNGGRMKKLYGNHCLVTQGKKCNLRKYQRVCDNTES